MKESPSTPTFVAPTVADAMEHTLELKRVCWSNPSAAEQRWRSLFDRYVNPVIGSIRVSDVTSRDVLRVLRRVQSQYPRMVSVVRQRIGVVLGWAVALRDPLMFFVKFII